MKWKIWILLLELTPGITQKKVVINSKIFGYLTKLWQFLLQLKMNVNYSKLVTLILFLYLPLDCMCHNCYTFNVFIWLKCTSSLLSVSFYLYLFIVWGSLIFSVSKKAVMYLFLYAKLVLGKTHTCPNCFNNFIFITDSLLLSIFLKASKVLLNGCILIVDEGFSLKESTNKRWLLIKSK